MLNRLILPLILIFLCSCSSALQRSRTPASAGLETCEAIAHDLVVLRDQRSFHLADFKNLNTDFIDGDPLLTKIVELHERPKNQEESRIILGLLRERSPASTSEELAHEYTRLLSDCSY